MHTHRYIYCLVLAFYLCTQIHGIRVKRKYAMCPPEFRRIGNVCYYISASRANWLDAHFECRDRKSQLAEPIKREDRYLRKYLNHLSVADYDELWIGGLFNWQRNKWQWGYDAKDMTYQSFSRMPSDRRSLNFHCTIMKAALKYRWSSIYCSEKRYFICQHRMPFVSAENRQRIYTRWNQTYPNQMANEIEISPYEDDLLRKRDSVRHRPNPSRTNHRTNGLLANDQKGLHDAHQANALPMHHNVSWTKPAPSRLQRPLRVGSANRTNGRDRDFQLPRHHTGGIRNRIQFDDSRNVSRHRTKPVKPDEWTHRPVNISANHERPAHVAQDAQGRRRADDRVRQEHSERRDRERMEAIRRNEAMHNAEKRQREQRERQTQQREQLDEQERREIEKQRRRDKELDEQQRHKELEMERQRYKQMAIDELAMESRQQEQQRRPELDGQRRSDNELEAQRRRQYEQLHGLQTNEILDGIEVAEATTTPPPTTTTTTTMPTRTTTAAPNTEHAKQRQKMRQKLENLTGEQLINFLRKRQEKRAKKRESQQIAH